MEQRLLTPGEYARLIRVSHKSVWNWAHDGSIPAIINSHTVRIIVTDPALLRQLALSEQAAEAEKASR